MAAADPAQPRTESHTAHAVAGDGVPLRGIGFVRSTIPTSDGRVKVGVDGHWYDVSSFVRHHPGGDVILEFAGRDASAVFRAVHDPAVLRRFEKARCGTYEPCLPPADKLYLELHEKFTQRGWLSAPSMRWYVYHVAEVLVLLAAAFASAAGWLPRASGVLTGLLVYLVWHRCAFLAHDHMHSQIFQNRKLDALLGTLFGSLGLGICVRGWADYHWEHHLFTNMLVPDVGMCDPQMKAPDAGVWCQDAQLLKFFSAAAAARMRKLQGYTFPIILPLFSRFKFVTTYLPIHWRTRPLSIAFFGGHLLWVLGLHSLLLSSAPYDALRSLLTAYLSQTLLSLQFFGNHYDRPWEGKATAKDKIGWLAHQVSVCVDYDDAPAVLRWLHGGLEDHTVHHLFPRMGREHTAAANRELDAALATLGLRRRRRRFAGAVLDVARHLFGVLGEAPPAGGAATSAAGALKAE